MSPIQLPKAVIIFADGACSGNPGPGGWGAIVVSKEGVVQEIGGSENPSTNNRMELTAVIRALDLSRDGNVHTPAQVYTDSTYVIRGITQWVKGWERRGWISTEGKPVANIDLWKQLIQSTSNREIHWHYVRGHRGIPGNDRVDEIAVEYSQRRSISLYRGPFEHYSVNVCDIPSDTSLPEMAPMNKAAQSKPFSYLSLVGRVPMRHSNWPSCQQRVKGVSGARFKKAMSQDEEKEILRSWGCRAEDLKQA
jgi:ribonuclease HI